MQRKKFFLFFSLASALAAHCADQNSSAPAPNFVQDVEFVHNVENELEYLSQQPSFIQTAACWTKENAKNLLIAGTALLMGTFIGRKIGPANITTKPQSALQASPSEQLSNIPYWASDTIAQFQKNNTDQEAVIKTQANEIRILNETINRLKGEIMQSTFERLKQEVMTNIAQSTIQEDDKKRLVRLFIGTISG